VVTLVPCLEPEEVCCHCSCSSFALPVEGSHVVSFGQQGLFVDIIVLGGSIQVEEAARQFEVQICEAAMMVGCAHELFCDGFGEGHPP